MEIQMHYSGSPEVYGQLYIKVLGLVLGVSSDWFLRTK